MNWTDTHSHLGWGSEPSKVPSAEAAASQVADANAAGVARMITIGTDSQTSRLAVEVAGAHDQVWATVGLHPHDARLGLDGVTTLATQPKVVAIGECGLDYHYEHSPRDIQRQVFAEQIELALAHDLALVIHTREAWDDTFAVLAEVGVPARTVFHCFTGGPTEAQRALEVGGYLSFSGIVSFKGADDLRAAAAMCPADRLLVETDSPYLAPVPHRGQPNRPALLPAVGEALAGARGEQVEETCRLTWANAETVFRLGT